MTAALMTRVLSLDQDDLQAALDEAQHIAEFIKERLDSMKAGKVRAPYRIEAGKEYDKITRN